MIVIMIMIMIVIMIIIIVVDVVGLVVIVVVVKLGSDIFVPCSFEYEYKSTEAPFKPSTPDTSSFTSLVSSSGLPSPHGIATCCERRRRSTSGCIIDKTFRLHYHFLHIPEFNKKSLWIYEVYPRNLRPHVVVAIDRLNPGSNGVKTNLVTSKVLETSPADLYGNHTE